MKNKLTCQKSKSIPLILVLILLSFLSFAQPYQPVVSFDSTSWTVAHEELFGIVTEHLYTKYHPDSTSSRLFLFGLYPDTIFVGSVREDTNTGKIWYKDIFNNDERLIMDMELSAGDIFEINPGVWSNVDSVFYYEGRKTIRFNLQTKWDEPVMFIEGVGPNIGMFYPTNDYDGHYAACKYNQDLLVYVNSNINFNDCVPKPVGITDNPAIMDAKIYPNPAISVLHVELPQGNRYETGIEILDISGRAFLKKSIHEKNSKFDVGHLKPGIYLVRITNGQHSQYQFIIFTN